MIILQLLLFPFCVLFFHLHWVGLVFAGSLVLALLVNVVTSIPILSLYLAVGGWIYLGMVMFTFCFNIAQYYEACRIKPCRNLLGHWHHYSTGEILMDVLFGAIWPIYMWKVHQEACERRESLSGLIMRTTKFCFGRLKNRVRNSD